MSCSPTLARRIAQVLQAARKAHIPAEQRRRILDRLDSAGHALRLAASPGIREHQFQRDCGMARDFLTRAVHDLRIWKRATGWKRSR